MLKPKFERHRLLRQQAGVLVFAATVETAQHQENINDIGFGAGPAYLQFDLIELEHTQLKLQLGQIRRLARQELCVDQAQQLFPFGVQVQILVDALHDGGLKAGDLVNFVQKIVQLAVNGGSGRLTVEVGWSDQERWQKVFRSSLMCSQSESYKIARAAPELDTLPVKKLTYLFGLPLVSEIDFCSFATLMASQNEASIWVSSVPIAARNTPRSRCSSAHHQRSPDLSTTASASRITSRRNDAELSGPPVCWSNPTVSPFAREGV
jgi:hypothetical protein